MDFNLILTIIGLLVSVAGLIVSIISLNNVLYIKNYLNFDIKDNNKENKSKNKVINKGDNNNIFTGNNL